MRRIAPLLLCAPALCCALVFVSCSDSGNSVEPDPDAGIPVGTITRTITTDGGTMRTRTRDGGPVVTVEFPAGAVRSPMNITIDPLSPGPGLWFDIGLEPAGLVFFQPVTVTVDMPDGVDVSEGQMMFLRPDDPVYVGTRVTPSEHRLETTVDFFGFTADSTRILARSPAAEAQTGGGNNLGGGPVPCQTIIASAKARFDAFMNIGEFEQAVDAALEIAGILERATCFAEASDWVDTAKDLACTGLTEAIDGAATTPTSDYGDFARQTGDIVDWVPIALRVAPDCPALDDYAAGLDNEVADFLNFFQPRLNALAANDWPTFADLKDEAISVIEVQVKAEMLGLRDGAALIEQQAFYPAVKRMREIAFTMCKDHGWHYPLSRLTATGFFAARDIVNATPPRPGSLAVTGGFADFTDEDIFADMQMCGTNVDVKTKVSSGGEFSAAHYEATAPGTSTREMTIDCPTRGTLVLDGAIDAFTCWNDLRADDEITVTFNYDEILTLRRPAAGNEYLGGTPVEIDILDAASASGFTPAEGFNTDLVFTRNRAGCDDRMWGNGDYDIFRTTLRWKNPTLQVEVDFPDTVDAGNATPVTVRVKVVDLLGQAGFFDAIDLALNVSGGTAAQTSGQTDANGEFTTTVTASNPAPSPGGPPGAASQGFSINVTATSFEGVTGQKSATATVLSCPADDHRLREGGGGTHTIDLDYGNARVWATAGANEYSYATTEFVDDFVVTPNDASLIGQRGYVYVKVHFKFQSSGYSQSNPAARVVIGPRNGYSSPYFFTNNFNTPGSGEERTWEDDWEVPISCTFGRVSAPLQVSTDAFARNTEGPCTVSAEMEWLGITKVTDESGNPVGYKICFGSGTDYQ